jgi:hypothetical protein
LVADSIVQDVPLTAPSSVSAAELDQLMAHYERSTLVMLETMRAALLQASAQQDAQADPLRRIFETAHDLKGQGTSFGYPLVTRIAQSLCRLGHGTPIEAPAPERLRAIGAHLTVLVTILEKRIKGDGGPLGDKLAAKLETMAA